MNRERRSGSRKFIISTITFLFLAFTLILSFSSSVFSVGDQVNNTPGVNPTGSSTLFGNRVVWSDARLSNRQIYVKDLSSSSAESRVSEASTNQINPAIWGSLVVWSENGDIWYKDLSSPNPAAQVTNDVTPQYNPAITERTVSGQQVKTVVWEQRTGAEDSQIYYKNLSEAGNGIAVSADTNSYQDNPVIFGDYVVWVSRPTTGGTNDLKIKNLTTDATGDITASGEQIQPAISGTKFVWADNRNGAYQIYYYDLLNGMPTGSAGTRLSSTTTYQENPSISDNRVVWEESPTNDFGDSSDVYLYDLLTSTKTDVATSGDILERHPSIHGDKIIWEANQSDMWAAWNIYFYQTGSVTVYSTGFEGGTPDITNPVSGWEFGKMLPSADSVYWGELNDAARSHSGSEVAWCAAQGGDLVNHRYTAHTNTYLRRVLDLTGYNSATLTFWYNIPSADPYGGDVGQIDISGGGLNAYKYYTNPTSGWTQETIDLKNYFTNKDFTGKIVTLEWRWYSDDDGYLGEGMYVDDISVTANSTFPLDHITVSPSSANVVAGQTRQFTATGYDAYGYSISGLTFDWTATGGTVNPPTGVSTTTFTAQTTPGTGYQVTATSGGKTDSASVNIISAPGPLDHFDISSVASPQTAGGAFSITVTAKDIDGNIKTDFMDSATLSDLTGTISPTSTTGAFTNGVWMGNVTITQARTANTITVFHSSSGKTGTSSSFDVNPGSIHHITVTPSSASISAGGTQSFSAQGYDTYGNLRSDTSFSWTATGGTVSLETGSQTTFTAQTTVGSGSVKASIGGIESIPASVTIIPDDLHHIHINPSSASVQVNTSQAFSAEGHDQYNNIISGLTFQWTATHGSITLAGLYTAPTVAGSDTVTARETTTLIAGTASVTVTPGPVARVDIAPATWSLAVDETKAFSAQGYDQYDNAISSLSYTWDATGGEITQTGLYAAGHTAGSGYQVTATSGGKTGYASVTIIPGPLDHFEISPVTSPQTAGGAFSLTITAHDAYHNVKEDFLGPANLSINGGSTISPSTATGFSNGVWTSDNVTVTKAGSGFFIIAESGGKTNNPPYSYFDVNPGLLYRIGVTPSPVFVRSKDTQVFTAQGYDQYDNPVSGLTFNWSISNPVGGTVTPSTDTLTATLTAGATAGDYQVTATSSDRTGAANVTVTRGADIGVYRYGSYPNWFYKMSTGTNLGGETWAINWGNPGGDTPLVGDFDGDNIDDIAIYRYGSYPNWFFKISQQSGDIRSGPTWALSWGNPGGDTPLVGDFDGNGCDDIAVYRYGSYPNWFFNLSKDDKTGFGKDVWALSWGNPGGDTPIVGNFNGDKNGSYDIDDIGVYRTGSYPNWFMRMSTGSNLNGATWALSWGNPGGDTPLVGDFDGTSGDDIGVYRYGSYPNWFFLTSAGTGFSPAISTWSLWWGNPGGDTPLVSDFNGDKKDDIGVYRYGSYPNWFFRTSQSGDIRSGPTWALSWGNPGGDTPLVGDFNGDTN